MNHRPTNDEEQKELEKELRHERQVYLRFRRRAVVGGAIVGAIMGAAFSWSYLGVWQYPTVSYVGAVTSTAALGALTGYLFLQIIMGRLALGPLSGGQARSGHGSASDDSGFDGDD